MTLPSGTISRNLVANAINRLLKSLSEAVMRRRFLYKPRTFRDSLIMGPVDPLRPAEGRKPVERKVFTK